MVFKNMNHITYEGVIVIPKKDVLVLNRMEKYNILGG